MIHPTAKVSKGTNRNMPVRNTLVQLLAAYTNPESHNAQGHRQTDNRMMPIADCVAVRSAKKHLFQICSAFINHKHVDAGRHT